MSADTDRALSAIAAMRERAGGLYHADWPTPEQRRQALLAALDVAEAAGRTGPLLREVADTLDDAWRNGLADRFTYSALASMCRTTAADLDAALARLAEVVP